MTPLFLLCCLAIPQKPAGVILPRETHHFYDRPAKIEIAAALILDAGDTAMSCHNLANGGTEQGLPTQSCAGVTGILAAQVAGQETLAYILHRTGHHKLERAARFISITGNTIGLVVGKERGKW